MSVYKAEVMVSKDMWDRYQRLLSIKFMSELKAKDEIYKKYHPKPYSGELIEQVRFNNKKTAGIYLVSYLEKYQINVMLFDLFDVIEPRQYIIKGALNEEVHILDFDDEYIIKFIISED